MRVVILDTETTDLRPGQIAQLSYIVLEKDIQPRAVNHFFKVDEMSPGAERIHGFSKEKLAELSGGKTFGDCWASIYKDFENAKLVAHNMAFDGRFLREEFLRLFMRMPTLDLECTMIQHTPIMRLPGKWGNYKWSNLQELANYYCVSQAAAVALQEQLYGSSCTAHDSRYDTAMLYLCYLSMYDSSNIKNTATGQRG